MTDCHLNLFYSYNHDKLIENNLTRAFVVSLKILQPDTRDHFLRSLLESPSTHRSPNGSFLAPSFRNAQFALQGHMDRRKSSRCKNKSVIAIASAVPEGDIAKESPTGKSIPDAWIYDAEEDFCYLIEAKVGANPIDDSQLVDHAGYWLGLETQDDVAQNLICITWYDVLAAIDSVRVADRTICQVSLQDNLILDSLDEFLGYFEYKRFQGFQFDALQPSPNFVLSHSRSVVLKSLAPPPGFCLGRASG